MLQSQKSTSALNPSFNQYPSYPPSKSLEPLFKELTVIIFSANSMSSLNLNCNFNYVPTLYSEISALLHL